MTEQGDLNFFLIKSESKSQSKAQVDGLGERIKQKLEKVQRQNREIEAQEKAKREAEKKEIDIKIQAQKRLEEDTEKRLREGKDPFLSEVKQREEEIKKQLEQKEKEITAKLEKREKDIDIKLQSQKAQEEKAEKELQEASHKLWEKYLTKPTQALKKAILAYALEIPQSQPLEQTLSQPIEKETKNPSEQEKLELIKLAIKEYERSKTEGIETKESERAKGFSSEMGEFIKKNISSMGSNFWEALKKDLVIPEGESSLIKIQAKGDNLIHFNIRKPRDADIFLKVPYSPNGFPNSCSECSAEMILRYFNVQGWSQYEIHERGYLTFEGERAEGDYGLKNMFLHENFQISTGKQITFFLKEINDGTENDLKFWLSQGIPLIIRIYTNRANDDRHTIVLIGYNKKGFFKHDNDLGMSLFVSNAEMKEYWSKNYFLIFPHFSN